jgi:hypothetical protein
MVGARVGGKAPKLTTKDIDAEAAPIWVIPIPVSRMIPPL